jgi:hypothetical protein
MISFRCRRVAARMIGPKAWAALHIVLAEGADSFPPEPSSSRAKTPIPSESAISGAAKRSISFVLRSFIGCTLFHQACLLEFSLVGDHPEILAPNIAGIISRALES